MKNLFWSILFLPALTWALGSCDFSGGAENQKGARDSVSIMTWNMQALFDGTEDGNEYDEYREAADWSQEKYAGRISAISKALSGMDTLPDIIAMQEIESARVVGDIAAALSGKGFKWSHFANCPDMSLGVGVVSRLHITETKVHSIIAGGETAPRPVLEVRIGGEREGADFVLFICHWKSKLGGDDVTENIRRASARIILRRIRELAEHEPELPVIVAGDLNENHDEFYRRNGGAICALLPDDPRSAEIAGFAETAGRGTDESAGLQKDFIIVSKNKPPVTRNFPEQALALYSPWAAELRGGTYYYRGDWETIDHFLLSAGFFNGGGWEFADCSVIDTPPFTNANGHPAAYNPRTGSGLSDHLPLLLFLNWQQEE